MRVHWCWVVLDGDRMQLSVVVCWDTAASELHRLVSSWVECLGVGMRGMGVLGNRRIGMDHVRVQTSRALLTKLKRMRGMRRMG